MHSLNIKNNNYFKTVVVYHFNLKMKNMLTKKGFNMLKIKIVLKIIKMIFIEEMGGFIYFGTWNLNGQSRVGNVSFPFYVLVCNRN